MAINQVLGSDKALVINDFNVVGLVQSMDWAPSFNATDIFELGRTSKVDTALELETSGSFEVESFGNTAGLLARMLVKRQTLAGAVSGDFAGFIYNQTLTSGTGFGKNGYHFSQNDLSECRFDLIVKEKPDQVNFSRSVYLPQCYLTSFSGRVDANGMASETYNWSGQFVTIFPQGFHDIRSIPAKRTGPLTATLIDSSSATRADLAAVSSTTHKVAYVVVDGQVITNQRTSHPSGEAYAALGASGVITITDNGSGFQIPASATIFVCVYKDPTPSTTFPALATVDRVQASGDAAPTYFVKGYNANIYLVTDPTTLTYTAATGTNPDIANSPAQSNQWLRAQSADWNVDLRVEALRQIAVNKQGTSVYVRVPTLPYNVTCNIQVTEADHSELKRMISKPFTGTNVADNVLDFSPASLDREVAVVVEYYSQGGSKLQTWWFKDLIVDGFGSRVSVGGRAEVNWSLRGTAFDLFGAKV